MTNKVLLSLIFCFILGVSQGICQDRQSSQTVAFDPLFWKDKLKLKYWQRVKINEINADFYGAIIESAKSVSETPAKEKVNKLLDQRSEKIWNTFSDRQKSIWRKLESQYITSASI